MKILVLSGSPNKNGTTALLAEQFIRGAEEAGHSIYRFDAAFQEIHPCNACNACQTTDKGCVFKDGMAELYPRLPEADAIVFVAPIYYYGLCAQLKLVIDRFYALGDALHGDKKCLLLMACEDDTLESVAGAITSIKGMAGYLGWEMQGIISALSCADRAAIEKTAYPKQAYELGKNLPIGDGTNW